MKKTGKLIAVMACILALAIATTSASSSTPKGIVPTEVKIAGGSTGGSWNVAATIISNILSKEMPGVRTTVSPGAALSNVVGIQIGEYQLSFSKMPTTFDGFDGKAPFSEKMDKIRNVCFLFDEATHIIVKKNSGINSVADLKGKRLTTLAAGNAGEVITRDILKVYGLTYKDMAKVSYANMNDMGEQFKDGLTDAICFGSALPVSIVMDIASVRDIKILEIPDDKFAELAKIAPSYMKNIIPAGTYKGIDKDIQTMGTAQNIIVSSDLDEDFVYKVTKAIVENRKLIGEGHAAYAKMTPETMGKDLGIAFHPGAEKYFREIGVIK